MPEGTAPFFVNEKVRELCGFSSRQASYILNKMRDESIIVKQGERRYSRYVLSVCFYSRSEAP